MFLHLPILTPQAPIQLSIDLARPGVAVSPDLFGLMTEEINYSYDGGLYGELVRNRAFLDDPVKTPHWTAVGGESTLSLERAGPTAARPVALKVQGAVANDGYWGFPVRPNTTYSLSVLGKGSGRLIASLESSDGGATFASKEVGTLTDSWKTLEVKLSTPGGITPTRNTRLVLRTEAQKTAFLSQVSLFPPTYQGHKNGNRPELLQLLIDMKPRFLRFPGGNYLEGNRPEERFPWKETLGPIESRPGHHCTWGYRSTDGMGLYEFLIWCEEMKAKPLLGVYAGYALGGQYVKSPAELKPFIDEALEEIEYVIGGPETKWGAQRVKDGHPKPFPLEYVEVGNEDGFDKSGSYETRFVQFYDAIKAKYPHLKVISTTGGKDWLGQKFPITQRTPDAWDEHYYSSNWDMMAMATKYDDYARTGPKVFVGEWAAQGTGDPWKDREKKGPTPDMSTAIADAAFMTGIERNSDVVAMACYAPLLVNLNPGGKQWAVNLIGYDALNVVGSPSYYAQQSFMANIGDRTVPLKLSGVPTQSLDGKQLPGVFSSVTKDSKTGTIYLKLVNALPESQTISLSIGGGKQNFSASEIVVSGPPTVRNTLEHPVAIVPQVRTLGQQKANFSYTLSGTSVTVLKLVPSR